MNHLRPKKTKLDYKEQRRRRWHNVSDLRTMSRKWTEWNLTSVEHRSLIFSVCDASLVLSGPADSSYVSDSSTCWINAGLIDTDHPGWLREWRLYQSYLLNECWMKSYSCRPSVKFIKVLLKTSFSKGPDYIYLNNF